MALADLFRRRPRRRLDDEELDSGDDLDRYDRIADRMDYEEGEDRDYGETLNVMDLSLGRAPEPESTSGEVWLRFGVTTSHYDPVSTNMMSPGLHDANPYFPLHRDGRVQPRDLRCASVLHRRHLPVLAI